jgi:nucleoid-associated protein YgaU
MGKVEKIAVLSVLFLIAVILVVSMTTDNPLDKANAAVLGEKSSVPSPAPNEAPSAALPEPADKLLSATLGTDSNTASAPAPAAPQPLAIPTGSLLKTTAGLCAGFDSQRLLYTWQSGDSYVALAKKLYGEPTKFTLIQNANEGREDIQPGEKILVPVFDVENVVEADKHPAAKNDGKKKLVAEGAGSAPASAAGRTHTVKKGDSLWKIAKAELGDGGRWKEIFELNKDKLKTPEALRDGMQLRLP